MAFVYFLQQQPTTPTTINHNKPPTTNHKLYTSTMIYQPYTTNHQP